MSASEGASLRSHVCCGAGDAPRLGTPLLRLVIIRHRDLCRAPRPRLTGSPHDRSGAAGPDRTAPGRTSWRRPAGRRPKAWSSAPRATSPYASGTPSWSPRAACPTTGSAPGRRRRRPRRPAGPRRARRPPANCPMHLAVYRHTTPRAVVHTHAVHATAVSTLVPELPRDPLHDRRPRRPRPRRRRTPRTARDELAENMLRALRGPHRLPAPEPRHDRLRRHPRPGVRPHRPAGVDVPRLADGVLRSPDTSPPCSPPTRSGAARRSLSGYGQRPPE